MDPIADISATQYDIRPLVTQTLETQENLIHESTVARIARLKAEKFEETTMFIQLLILAFFVLGVLVWWGLTRIDLQNRYKDMIDWIDQLRKDGNYRGKGGGIQFAFWYHYPHLSAVQLTNINLPAAVVYGYYGSPNSVSKDFINATDSLEKMFQYSELHGRATSIQILCYWVNCCSNNADTSICLQYCGVPPLYTNSQAVTTVTNTTLGYAMTFDMVVPGLGALVGAGVGFGMGMWQSSEMAGWYDQECKFSEQQGCQDPSSLQCGTVI